MIPFNPNNEYICSPNNKSTGFSYLQFLVINYHEIDNCLDLMQKDIDEMNKVYDNNYINHQNTKGWTALQIACRNSNTFSHINVVKLLLDNGADPNIKDLSEYSPLISACLNCGGDSTLDTIKLLLDNGADINIRAKSYFTPLIISSYYPAKLLIKRGANINLINKFGYNALLSAIITEQDVKLIKLLIDSGSDINLLDNNQCNALYYYCNYHNNNLDIDIFTYLLKNTKIIDYNNICENIKDDITILEKCIEYMDFENIDHVKKIYKIGKENKNFINLLRFKILNYDKYNKIDRMFIIDTNMSREDYDSILNIHNNKMKKRVN